MRGVSVSQSRKWRIAVTAVSIGIFSILGGCNRPASPEKQTSAPRIHRIEHQANESGRKKTHPGTKVDALAGAASSSATAAIIESDDPNSTYPRLICKGRVTLPDGSPAKGAKVRARQFDWKGGSHAEDLKTLAERSVGDDGYYSISTTGTQYYYISASLKGYASQNALIISQGYKPLTAGSDETVQKDIPMQPGSHIKGRVVDDQGKAVTEGTVRYTSNQTDNSSAGTIEKISIESNGTFELTDILPVETALTAEAPDHVPQSTTVLPPQENVVLTLSTHGATLSGNVFLLSTRQGVSSATVQLSQNNTKSGPTSNFSHMSDKSAVTDGLGGFEFNFLPAGTYVLKASSGKLRNLPQTENSAVKLAEAETTSGIDLYLYPGHVITGVVRDHASKEPIEGALVSYGWRSTPPKASDEGVVRSDSKGVFRLEHLFSNGSQLLAAYKDGYTQPGSYNGYGLSFDPAKLESKKDIELEKSITVSGSVKDQSGNPVKTATVELYDSKRMYGGGYPVNKKPVNPDGTYSLDASPYSILRVLATDPKFPQAMTEIITMQDTPKTGVDIIMKPGQAVSGIVVDPDDKPVEGAAVSYSNSITFPGYSMSNSLGSFNSDKEGRFHFSNVPTGNSINLSANKKGYAGSKPESLTLKDGEGKSDVKLQLQKSHFLAGHIYDKDKKPVTGANINAYSSNGGNSNNSTSDSDGKYRIEGLPEGTCSVNVWTDINGSAYRQNVKVDQDNYDITMDMETVEMIGHVVDYKTGNPISAFDVTSQGNSVKITKDAAQAGTFHMDIKPNYGYKLTIRAASYMDLVTDYLSVQNSQTKLEKTFKMGPGGSVIGKVVSKSDQKPLSGVSVILLDSANSWDYYRNGPTGITKTDNSGDFRFDVVQPGSRSISITPAEPLVTKTLPATITQGETTDLGTVQVGGGGTVKGTVVRVPGDVPVSGKQVTLSGQTGMAISGSSKTTDDSGAFEFDAIPAGNYTVQLASEKQSNSVVVDEDTVREVVIRLGSGTLKGRILKGGVGYPAYVNLRRDGNDAQSKSFQSDGDGNFNETGFAPGTWNYSIFGDNGKSSLLGTVDIAETGVTEKDFVLPSGRIVGRVVDESDKPVSGAKVNVVLKGTGSSYEQMFVGRSISETSKDDGSFALEGLTEGSYTVSASKSGAGAAKEDNVSVPENGDSAPVNLKLLAGQTGTLVSVALNMTNSQPIPEAWCILSTPSGNFDHGKTRDSDGVLTIPDLPVGTYTAQVSSFGFSVNEHQVEIKAGETTRLDDVLYESGALRWTITDKNGSGIKGLACKIVPDDPNSIEKPRDANTDASGLCVVRGLYPGSYTGTTQPEGKAQIVVKFTVTPHQLSTVSSIVE
jgi:hypothetical protein